MTTGRINQITIFITAAGSCVQLCVNLQPIGELPRADPQKHNCTHKLALVIQSSFKLDVSFFFSVALSLSPLQSSFVHTLPPSVCHFSSHTRDASAKSELGKVKQRVGKRRKHTLKVAEKQRKKQMKVPETPAKKQALLRLCMYFLDENSILHRNEKNRCILNSFARSKLSGEKAIFLLEKDFGLEFASTFVSLMTSIHIKLFAYVVIVLDLSKNHTRTHTCRVWKVCHDSARYSQ